MAPYKLNKGRKLTHRASKIVKILGQYFPPLHNALHHKHKTTVKRILDSHTWHFLHKRTVSFKQNPSPYFFQASRDDDASGEVGKALKAFLHTSRKSDIKILTLKLRQKKVTDQPNTTRHERIMNDTLTNQVTP